MHTFPCEFSFEYIERKLIVKEIIFNDLPRLAWERVFGRVEREWKLLAIISSRINKSQIKKKEKKIYINISIPHKKKETRIIGNSSRSLWVSNDIRIFYKRYKPV